jgi:hypothetical protein
MILLRQSTASQEILIGPFLDDTDGKTAETALTIANTDIKLWVSGATTEVSKNSGGATHIAAGRYYAVLDATDTATLGSGELNVSVAGALPCKVRFCVVPAVVYDAIVAGTGAGIRANAISVAGTTQAAGDLATLLGLVATAANLATAKTVIDQIATKTAVLPASYPANFVNLLINGSGHISRVTLVDTTTTNTDMRGTNNAATASALTVVGADVATVLGTLGSLELSLDSLSAGVNVTSIAADTITAASVATDAGAEIATATAALLTPALVKIQAATYDSVTVAGDVLTLSNGHTQTVSTGGRVTA